LVLATVLYTAAAKRTGVWCGYGVIAIDTVTANLHQPASPVRITDEAEAERFLEDVYGVKLRLRWNQEQRRDDALLTHFRRAAGAFVVDEVYVAGDVEAAPDPLNFVVGVWATGGNVVSECDGMVGEAAADEIALLSQPDLPYRSHVRDLRATAVLLDPAVVASVAAGVPNGQAPLPIRFTSLQPVDAAAARLWKRTVTYVVRTVLADDTLVTPLIAGHASRLLAAVILSTFPYMAAPRTATSDRTDDRPVLLRRALEYMDANATNDIGLADIAEAIHVSPRAVQYMFRRHLASTPLQYLRRARLHYAHLELSAADQTHDTVTEIAARWGFAHTGRFAVLYRQTYGQSPHQTLRG
jgi:AraC-like DNA-binding protein